MGLRLRQVRTGGNDRVARRGEVNFRAAVFESREHGGVLTTADLSDYRPIWREPLRFRAFGWEVASMRLPSSGGFILIRASTWRSGLRA